MWTGLRFNGREGWFSVMVEMGESSLYPEGQGRESREERREKEKEKERGGERQTEREKEVCSTFCPSGKPNRGWATFFSAANVTAVASFYIVPNSCGLLCCILLHRSRVSNKAVAVMVM